MPRLQAEIPGKSRGLNGCDEGIRRLRASLQPKSAIIGKKKFGGDSIPLRAIFHVRDHFWNN